jgi:hypothetical protein
MNKDKINNTYHSYNSYLIGATLAAVMQKGEVNNLYNIY